MKRPTFSRPNWRIVPSKSGLLWGPKWGDYVRSGQPLDQVLPE
jgi:hypothetical protein